MSHKHLSDTLYVSKCGEYPRVVFFYILYWTAPLKNLRGVTNLTQDNGP